MADVVVRLSEKEVRALVDGASPQRRDAFVALQATLRAALGSPPIEERREYRVVADFAAEGDQSITLVGPGDIEASENVHREAVASYRHGGVYKNPQAQSRTITTFSDGSSLTSPWTDLPSEEGERDA